MFIENLHKLKKEKRIASFYTDEDDTSKFMVGYVMDYNDKYFIVAAISPQGLYDGFVLKKTESIFRINMDSIYEKKILSLSKYHKIIYEEISFKEDNLILGLLSFAKIKNYVVSIELLNSGYYDIQGYVEVVDNDGCKIKQITEYGELDGICFVTLSDITQISCNSEDEINLKILNSNK